MRVNEGALQRYRKFTDQYNTCLYDHTCLLANEEKAALPYWRLSRRPRHTSSAIPDGNQPDANESKVAQQPTYDTSYPAGLIVKWKDHGGIKLATVVESAQEELKDGVNPACTIRVLNATDPITVPASSLSPCTFPDPADIPTSAKEIDPNAMNVLISKEDLDKLWHRDQVAFPERLRMYLYWYQRLQHPSHISMVGLAKRGALPSAIKYVKKAPP
eukprot:4072207-Ditylum_brightwellii.AAC.1